MSGKINREKNYTKRKVFLVRTKMTLINFLKHITSASTGKAVILRDHILEFSSP